MQKQSAIMIRLPEVFGAKEARKLGRELKNMITGESPSVVVDLSQVRTIDLAGLEGLLNCMEAVAKNDGALQLSTISPEAATILELTRINRLFEKFPSCDVQAVEFTAPAAYEEEGVSERAVQPQPAAA